ncbi:reverse transcriptase, partial [Globisporangium splendens]
MCSIDYQQICGNNEDVLRRIRCGRHTGFLRCSSTCSIRKDRVFGVPKQCRMWGDKRNYLTHNLELQASTSRVDGLLGRWMGRTLTEQALNLFLPHIASRTAPPGQRSLLRELEKHFGVLERQDLSRQLEAWATARLYFDGGARGNPGPGGSGWALIFLNERSNRWELKACGYAYMGPEVTNNWCEYSALKDGLAYSAHYLQHYEVKLEVFGDSQTIIASQNGFASIRQTKLQPLAVRVNQIIANFAWTSWNHTKREQNKMADLLANMAMNSKNAKILADESREMIKYFCPKSQLYSTMISDAALLPAVCGHHTEQHKTPRCLRPPYRAAQDPVTEPTGSVTLDVIEASKRDVH